jgi:hypothetical protein
MKEIAKLTWARPSDRLRTKTGADIDEEAHRMRGRVERRDAKLLAARLSAEVDRDFSDGSFAVLAPRVRRGR